MGGPLKTITGSASSPAIFPNGNPNVGIHFANGKVNFVGGATGLRYIGELIPYTLLTPEPLTVLPYGQTLLRASYPDLWAKAQMDIAAGNIFYNNGNGTTTFGIGDMRGRVPAGKDDMGGTAAGRLTTGGASIDGTTLGATGGVQITALSLSQIPSHDHPVYLNDPGHNHSQTVPGGIDAQIQQGTSTLQGWHHSNAGTVGPASTGVTLWSGASGTGNQNKTATTGSGQAHQNCQPTLVCNFLLYVGA